MKKQKQYIILGICIFSIFFINAQATKIYICRLVSDVWLFYVAFLFLCILPLAGYGGYYVWHNDKEIPFKVMVFFCSAIILGGMFNVCR